MAFINEDGTLKEGMSKDQADAVWNAYVEAKQNYLDAMQAQAEAIQAELENGLQAIIDEAFGQVFNKLGINEFSEVWNLQKAQDDMYFDVISENEVVKVWRDTYSKFPSKKGARCSLENLLKRIIHDNPVGTILPSVVSVIDTTSQYRPE